MAPVVHINRTDLALFHTQAAMMAAALEAQETAVGDTGPLGMGSATIDALVVAFERIQQGTAVQRKAGEIGAGNIRC